MPYVSSPVERIYQSCSICVTLCPLNWMFEALKNPVENINHIKNQDDTDIEIKSG